MNIETKKIIFLFTVGFLFSVAFSWILSKQPSVLIRSDHFSRWYATYKLVTEHRSIYDPRNGEELVALYPVPANWVGNFLYPAHLLIFTLPFAQLPYPVAHFIWLILIQLFLLAGIGVVSRETRWPHTINQFSLVFMLSMFFLPNLQNTIWGQFNTIAALGLALVYAALRRERYFLAGIFAIGFTFKPQTMLLTLLFLLLWASFHRKRWTFILGFGLCSLGFWLFAEALVPHWITSFLRGVISYSNSLDPKPVLSKLWLPSWFLSALVIGSSAWLFLKNIHSAPTSIQFSGLLALSLGVWWVFVPVIGMMHLAGLPIIAIILFSALERGGSKLYLPGVLGVILLYLLGFIGFLYGLSRPELYGIHIELAELAIKIGIPVLILLLATPLSLPKIENSDLTKGKKMSKIHAEASQIIDTRPEEVYSILSDYHTGHLAILPKPYFAELTVEQGGQGAGTVIRVRMDVMGLERSYRLIVSEPEPGRVLIEADDEAGVVTTFTVDPTDGGKQSRVTIATDAKTSPGLTGFVERLVNPAITRRIYRAELNLLAEYVRNR